MSGIFRAYRSAAFLPSLYRFVPGLVLLTLLSACNTTKYLGPDEVFLEKNEIELISEQQIKKKGNLKYELATLYKQRPNTNFLFVPREWYYYEVQDTVGKSSFTKGFKRWMVRQFGEEPVLYDPGLTETTERSMEYYLQHKGFFLARVQSFYEYTNKRNTKVQVNYEVNLNHQYLIDTVRFTSRDTQIHTILQAIRRQTLLKPGIPMDAKTYEAETNRIVRHMKNQGYAYFGPQHIASLEADSSDFRVKLTLEVLLPANDSLHRTYRVGNLFLYPNYAPSITTLSRIDTISEGIYFLGDSTEYTVREKTLLDALYLKKGDLFRQENYDRTNRQLSNLGIFRFVTLRAEPDPEIPDQLNFRIYLTPNKKFEWGSDIEVNTTNSQAVFGRWLLGASANLLFRHRNLLRGAELYIANLKGGVDVNVQDGTINTVDLGLQNDLYLPKFIDFFGVYRFLDRLRLIRRPFYRALEDKAATRLTLNYNYLERYLNRDKLFSLNSLNTTFGYDFSPSTRHRYIINHFGIDYLSPDITTTFDTLILQKNPNLRRSFDKQLFTSFILRDFNYNYTGLSNRFGESYSMIMRLEVSGLEVLGINALYNALTGPSNRDTFELAFGNDTIQFSQYGRVELDFRYHRNLGRGQSIVLRAALGLAFPYGFSSTVPYVKQFSAGGPQSVRGWNAREIGPGGFLDTLTLQEGINPTLFYQTGDFRLDLNLEYRFSIFTLFGIKYEGALFLDAGNVWNLKADPERPFAQLRWTPAYDENNQRIADNLFKSMAVGTGFGLRLDFSYFILRLDIGMKLRNPYLIDAQGNPVTQFWRSPFENGIRDMNLNLGLGYPF